MRIYLIAAVLLSTFLARLCWGDRHGAPLWRGSYDEAQRGLVDEPRSLLRARERGFRFVTAAALARYGARELVRALGAEPWR